MNSICCQSPWCNCGSITSCCLKPCFAERTDSADRDDCAASDERCRDRCCCHCCGCCHCCRNNCRRENFCCRELTVEPFCQSCGCSIGC